MAWGSLASNQWVSFTDASGSGYILKPGQSHVTSDQWMTKDEAEAKYYIAAGAFSGYAGNQWVPKGLWAPGLVGNEYRSQTFYKNDCYVGELCYSYTLYNTGGVDLNYSYRPCNGGYASGTLGVEGSIVLCAQYEVDIIIDSGTGYTTSGGYCSTPGTGSGVLYSVLANTYYDTTVAAANAQADAEIALNGQDYANANGTCGPGENTY